MVEPRITYKHRLYPSRAQAEALDFQLSEACRLYNAALQERRDAWRINHISLNFYSQCKQLAEIRADGDTGIINAQSAQDVLHRADRTFTAFFNRVKRKEKTGFPRFKSRARFDSLTYPAYGNGCKLAGAKLRLQGIGLIKVKLHRAIEGKIKTVTVKRECGKWHAFISEDGHTNIKDRVIN